MFLLISLFDLGDDRQAQLFPGAPVLPVQDVLLRGREQRFRGLLSVGGRTRLVVPSELLRCRVLMNFCNRNGLYLSAQRC